MVLDTGVGGGYMSEVNMMFWCMFVSEFHGCCRCRWLSDNFLEKANFAGHLWSKIFWASSLASSLVGHGRAGPGWAGRAVSLLFGGGGVEPTCV